MKKFLICIILMMIMLSSVVQANTLNTLTVDVYVDKKGDAIVTETWDYTSNENTEIYHAYKNIGNSEFEDLEVSDSNGNIYTFEEKWNINRTLEEKAKKCGFHQVPDGIEICWGITKYDSLIYKVSYKITNFVTKLDDSQMIYWELIPGNRESKIKLASVTIRSDLPFANTIDVWGYGNKNGLCYVADGVIKMRSPENGLKSNEYMTLLAKFSGDYFEIDEKTDRYFDYYLEMSQEGAKKASSFGASEIFILLIDGFIFLVIIGAFVKAGQRILVPKEYKNFKNDVEYYRDIPADLFTMYAIASSLKLIKKDEDIFGSIFLRWIKEKKAEVIKPAEEGVIKTRFKLKKDTVNIKLYEEYLDETKFEMQDEAKLYKYVYEASKDSILEKNEFDKWAKSNSAKFMNQFESIKKAAIRKLKEDNYIIVENKKEIFSKEAMEIAKQILGLKKYLEDYTLINEREAIEVAIFEEYLIFAQMMGIADKVLEQFNKLYPNLASLSAYDSYDNIRYVRVASYSMTKKAIDIETAKARSYSGGGGGFSSGGGGGGSFGGGGSMGSR